MKYYYCKYSDFLAIKYKFRQKITIKLIITL